MLHATSYNTIASGFNEESIRAMAKQGTNVGLWHHPEPDWDRFGEIFPRKIFVWILKLQNNDIYILHVGGKLKRIPSFRFFDFSSTHFSLKSRATSSSLPDAVGSGLRRLDLRDGSLYSRQSAHDRWKQSGNSRFELASLMNKIKFEHSRVVR